MDIDVACIIDDWPVIPSIQTLAQHFGFTASLATMSQMPLGMQLSES